MRLKYLQKIAGLSDVKRTGCSAFEHVLKKPTKRRQVTDFVCSKSTSLKLAAEIEIQLKATP